MLYERTPGPSYVPISGVMSPAPLKRTVRPARLHRARADIRCYVTGPIEASDAGPSTHWADADIRCYVTGPIEAARLGSCATAAPKDIRCYVTGPIEANIPGSLPAS